MWSVEHVKSSKLADFLNEIQSKDLIIKNVFPYMSHIGIYNQVIFCNKDDNSKNDDLEIMLKRVEDIIDNRCIDMVEDLKPRIIPTKCEPNKKIDVKPILDDKLPNGTFKVSTRRGKYNGLTQLDVIFTVCKNLTEPFSHNEVSVGIKEFLKRENVDEEISEQMVAIGLSNLVVARRIIRDGAKFRFLQY